MSRRVGAAVEQVGGERMSQARCGTGCRECPAESNVFLDQAPTERVVMRVPDNSGPRWASRFMAGAFIRKFSRTRVSSSLQRWNRQRHDAFFGALAEHAHSLFLKSMSRRLSCTNSETRTPVGKEVPDRPVAFAETQFRYPAFRIEAATASSIERCTGSFFSLRGVATSFADSVRRRLRAPGIERRWRKAASFRAIEVFFLWSECQGREPFTNCDVVDLAYVRFRSLPLGSAGAR